MTVKKAVSPITSVRNSAPDDPWFESVCADIWTMLMLAMLLQPTRE